MHCSSDAAGVPRRWSRSAGSPLRHSRRDPAFAPGRVTDASVFIIEAELKADYGEAARGRYHEGQISSEPPPELERGGSSSSG